MIFSKRKEKVAKQLNVNVAISSDRRRLFSLVAAFGWAMVPIVFFIIRETMSVFLGVLALLVYFLTGGMEMIADMIYRTKLFREKSRDRSMNP